MPVDGKYVALRLKASLTPISVVTTTHELVKTYKNWLQSCFDQPGQSRLRETSVFNDVDTCAHV